MNSTDMTPRQRRRIQRLENIKNQAMQMVVEEGIDDFSIHKLAERLDLTPGALYRYFDSRDAILATVQTEVLEEFDAFFGRVEARANTANTLEHVVIMAQGYVALQALQAERFRLISQFVAGPDPVLNDSLASEVVGPTLRVVGRFVSAIDAAQRDGSLDQGNTLHRAAIAWSSLQGILVHKKLTRLPQVPLSPDELIKELIRTLLVGWGADLSAVEEALNKSPNLDFYRRVLEDTN